MNKELLKQLFLLYPILQKPILIDNIATLNIIVVEKETVKKVWNVIWNRSYFFFFYVQCFIINYFSASHFFRNTNKLQLLIIFTSTWCYCLILRYDLESTFFLLWQNMLQKEAYMSIWPTILWTFSRSLDGQKKLL